MKRRTNLFYLSGDDSKFITFSNYGESLTGNFLATDWKLFPSKFICMYIKALDVEDENVYNNRKKMFIKYIASYYENKLAFLRDYYISKDINIEQNLLPLNYLLEALYRLPEDLDITNIKSYNEITGNNDEVKISFIGDITEQDYNGTYTDIINVINSCDKAKGDLIIDNSTDRIGINYYDSIVSIMERKKLYGWVETNSFIDENGLPITSSQYVGPSDYSGIEPIYDTIDDSNNHNYYSTSCITGLSTKQHEDSENIKFNIIIPLYDLINVNADTNTVSLVEDEKITVNNVEVNGIDLSNTSVGYTKNVPMGIWFAEQPIELKRDRSSGYAPAWSLLLSSQFKPFPYSRKIPSEITQDSTKEAYATYSQILIRQNKLLDKLEDMTSQISALHKRVDQFESKLNTIGTSYTVDKMHTELINFENHISNNFNNFKNEIYSYMTNNWKGYIS